jgi:hypothetical protein
MLARDFISSHNEKRSGVNWVLRLNTISDLEAVTLTKQYNKECSDSDPFLNPSFMTDIGLDRENTYRFELWANDELAGIAVIGAAFELLDDEDYGVEDNCYSAWINVGVAFISKKYRHKVSGKIFSRHCTWAIEDILSHEVKGIVQNPQTATVMAVIEAYCLSKGGLRFAKMFADYFGPNSDFTFELHGLGIPFSSYVCSIEIDDLEMAA